MVVIRDRASRRNNLIPLSRPRIERERRRRGAGSSCFPADIGWLVGDRREALREFAGLVGIEQSGRP